MQNKLLLLELEKERKLREEAHETLRTAGFTSVVSSGPGTSSPSGHIITQQATTSIASAPEISESEAGAHAPTQVECIPCTQDLMLLGVQSEVQEDVAGKVS